MKNRFQSLRLALTALVLGVSASAASAAILNPGDGGAIVGTNVADRPELAGLVLADVLRPFTITSPGGGSFSGILQDRVVRGVDGALLFEARIRDTRSVGLDTGAPAASLSSVLRGSFNSGITAVVEAEFRTDSDGTLGPDLAGRTPSPGDGVGFLFSNGLSGGTESHFFFVRTGAPSFNDGGLYQLTDSNGNSVIVTAFQPSVPEPASAGLLGASALAFFARRRRMA